MRILLVEDDFAAAGACTHVMRASGFTVDHVATGQEAVEMLKHYDYDIAVLELMLPDIEGYEVVRRVRVAKIDTPIVILSGLTRPQAKVRAFSVGADDYVTKPFDSSELVARMQAILRRSKGYSESCLRVGPLELSIDSREVTIKGQPIHLTGKEYAILELLVLRKGIVLTKDAFLNHLYGGMDEPEMKIIDVFVCKLRRKLQAAGAKNLISTVWGRGYMLRDQAADEAHVSLAQEAQAMGSVPAGTAGASVAA
ncbi:two component response regulator CtrA [Ameyamaea chiangmaiensis NBRC 103196]|uniref:Response regulator transcription factor n=1 Tax=Ameyamaea chiangmaiensis TaxID=442969 RepID=A0A850P873_9PROT|nr:response regulator transcription factor [Ameyamaea chiangmaiensis]MBS4076024.1 response regulator transcription factor [Ameyamaea chiangmaiensis]NVN40108.1 response regulator transcription factor [Ameyamaea chiangmaiensis]GBQ61421.1 two component response regulator CtrA [Ameyamaea chiangmaiensis NBRC 103196]